MNKKILTLTVAGVLLAAFLFSNAEVYAINSPEEKVPVITPDRINTLDRVIKISQPNFNVTINGIAIKNKNSAHPIIFRYKNITYIPLDWIDSHWLGLDINMDENNSIIINNTEKVNSFVSWRSDSAEGAIYNLNITKINGIIANKVAINGKEIDNKKETYPVLEYLGDVYIPLTWNLIVNEFGWFYAWDAKTGLTINTGAKGVNTSNLLLQTQVLSKINEFTYNKSAYIIAEVKSFETNEVFKVDLQKDTAGILEHLNRSIDQFITDSYTNLYFESHSSNNEDNKNPIIIKSADGGHYELDGYYYRYVLEQEYKNKISDIYVSGKSYLDDIHIIGDKVQKDGTFIHDDNIYQALRNAGYFHEQTPEYNICDNLLKFEFLSDRNKVLSFEKTISDGFDESYKIEYETNDRNYLNPKVNTWDKNTYINQPKVSTKKTVVVSFTGGDITQININDGQFEYVMSIKNIK